MYISHSAACSLLLFSSHRRFTVEDVVAVEGKSDRQGTRYLLELKLHDAQENRNLRFAEYVFQSNSSALSLAGGLAWNRRAVVNFIVPIKNQAKWMSFLVSELTDLYLRTGDEKFHLVVVDFESNDGDVASILQRSPLSQKCTLIKKSGAFHKTMAIQEAVESVTDVNSIVFLFDLHITLPRIFLDTIRKVSRPYEYHFSRMIYNKLGITCWEILENYYGTP